MYILYAESTVQVKQLLLAGVKPSVEYGLVKAIELKSKFESNQKYMLLKESLEPVSLKLDKTTKYNPRFKTEKCRQFYEMNFCEYGDRCMFAHGLHELKAGVVARPRNYKTRMCTTYQFDGFCTFGSRCAFVHKHEDPLEILESTISQCRHIPMPENLSNKCRPEFYPTDILIRKPNREMLREQELLPSSFNKSERLSTFKKITNTKLSLQKLSYD